MSTQLEAVVLKNFDYQDHHKIVKMISPSHGLISVFVSYANKKKSRYRAIAEPLTCVTIHVKVPNEVPGGLYYLIHGEVIDSFYELKIDYEKVMIFYEMVEIILRGDLDETHLPYAYRSLKEILINNATDEIKFRFSVIVFKAKMLISLGVVPAVDGCVGCHQTTKIVTASVSEGGLICEACYTGDGIWISTDLIPLWRGLFKVSLERLIKLDVRIDELEMLEIWMKAYYEHYSNIRFAKRLTI